MFIINPTKQLKFLSAVKEENTLFISPEYIEFPYINNVNKLALLKGIVENLNYKNIKDIVGSSASSIVALQLALGYSVKEIILELKSASFCKLLNNNDDNEPYKPLTIVVESRKKEFKRILKKLEYKTLKKDNFLIWAQKQVTEKLGHSLTTFADLHKKSKINNLLKNIHLVGLNLTTNKLMLLNYKNTPNMPIAMALRICMSFSTTFSIVEIKDLTTNNKCIYADGGIPLRHINFSKYKIAC